MAINIDSIKITPALISLIAETDEFKGAWQTLQHLTPERLSILRKVATIESIGSSTRIEGVKLTDKEIETLLANLNIHAFRSRDEEEVIGYAETIEQIFTSFNDIPLSENYIKQLHHMLLKYSSKDTRHRGHYKTTTNHVEAFDANGNSLGVIFATASPFETPFKMQELIEWTQSALIEKQLHPLLIIGIFAVCFLAIHPFQDGNGRLSRILTTLLLLKSGYTYVPYSSLESIIEENKENYYLSLRKTQLTLATNEPQWNAWLMFFLQALKKQKDQLFTKLQREKMLTETLPALSLKIITLTREHGRMTIKELEKLTGANRNTLKAQLHNLVKTHKLIKYGKGRATWYVLA